MLGRNAQLWVPPVRRGGKVQVLIASPALKGLKLGQSTQTAALAGDTGTQLRGRISVSEQDA